MPLGVLHSPACHTPPHRYASCLSDPTQKGWPWGNCQICQIYEEKNTEWKRETYERTLRPRERQDWLNLWLAMQIPMLLRREAAPSQLVWTQFINLISIGGKRDWPCAPALRCTPAVVKMERQIPGRRQQDIFSARAGSSLATNPVSILHFLVFKTAFSNQKAQLPRGRTFKEQFNFTKFFTW